MRRPRRWVEPAWIAAYSALCAVRGFQYAFDAFARHGFSMAWVWASAEVGALLFVLGLPGFALVVLAHHATRRAPMERRVMALCLAVVAGAASFAAVSVPLDRLLFGTGPVVLPASIETAGHFILALTFGGCLAAVLAYAGHIEDLDEAARRAALAPMARATSEAESRLRQLQAQIEPHFLFNTLANVRRLAEDDAAAAARLLDRLADYIEHALPGSRTGWHRVADEVALVRAYLDIAATRMGHRLRVDMDVPEDLEAARLPPLMLATLIENAVKHGLSPRASGGSLRVRIRREGTRLEASVVDDGVGFRASSGNGIGLANTRARLRALYGEAATLSLQSGAGGGVVATLRLPLEQAA